MGDRTAEGYRTAVGVQRSLKVVLYHMIQIYTYNIYTTCMTYIQRVLI